MSYCSASFLFYTAFGNVHVCVPGTHTHTYAISSVLPGGSELDRSIQHSAQIRGVQFSLRKTSSPKPTFTRMKRALQQRWLSCKMKICFMDNSVLLLQLLLCIPSYTLKGSPDPMAGKVKTCAETESRAAVWSQTWERIVFILMISAGRNPIWSER